MRMNAQALCYAGRWRWWLEVCYAEFMIGSLLCRVRDFVLQDWFNWDLAEGEEEIFNASSWTYIELICIGCENFKFGLGSRVFLHCVRVLRLVICHLRFCICLAHSFSAFSQLLMCTQPLKFSPIAFFLLFVLFALLWTWIFPFGIVFELWAYAVWT